MKRNAGRAILATARMGLANPPAKKRVILNEGRSPQRPPEVKNPENLGATRGLGTAITFWILPLRQAQGQNDSLQIWDSQVGTAFSSPLSLGGKVLQHDAPQQPIQPELIALLPLLAQPRENVRIDPQRDSNSVDPGL